MGAEKPTVILTIDLILKTPWEAFLPSGSLCKLPSDSHIPIPQRYVSNLFAYHMGTMYHCARDAQSQCQYLDMDELKPQWMDLGNSNIPTEEENQYGMFVLNDKLIGAYSTKQYISLIIAIDHSEQREGCLS